MRKKNKIKINIGDVFQIKLPNGKYAYGRLYYGKTETGIYKTITEEPNKPPISSREFLFHVWFQTGVIEDGICPIVGNDPFDDPEEMRGSPKCRYNDLIKGYTVFYKGEMYGAQKDECEGLEDTSIWPLDKVIERIMNYNESEEIIKKREENENKLIDKINNYNKNKIKIVEPDNHKYNEKLKKKFDNNIFLEIVFDVSEIKDLSIYDRDNIEDALNDALEEAGIGEATGSGEGSNKINIDVEIRQESNLAQALSIIKIVLNNFKIQNNAIVNRYEPEVKQYKVF